MSAAKKKTAPEKKAPAKKAPMKHGPRADFGAPIDGYFAKQKPEMRAVLEAIRARVKKVAPDATGSLKWGMPVFSIGTQMICATRALASYVNLVLTGPSEIFDDPDGLLVGEGKTGRRLVVKPGAPLPTKQLDGWLKAAAARARSL